MSLTCRPQWTFMSERNNFIMNETAIELTGQTLAQLYNSVIYFCNLVTSKHEDGWSQPKISLLI